MLLLVNILVLSILFIDGVQPARVPVLGRQRRKKKKKEKKKREKNKNTTC